MNKKMVGIAILTATLATAREQVITWADTFQAMRECEEGKIVGKKLDGVREKLSKEIQKMAQDLAQEEKELKSKLPTMKKDVVEREERKLAKRRRALEDIVRDGEEELKMMMQQETEKLALKVEEGIVAVAKEKNVDAVIDRTTGRVLYVKEDNKADLTSDAIAHINKRQPKKDTTVAQANTKKATATT